MLLFIMITGTVTVQSNTNFPYTRYGYGDLSDQSFGNSRAMRGIASGLRDGAQINPLDPASYTVIDSLISLFRGDASLRNVDISGSGAKLNAKNSSFGYLTMQFRLHPRIAISTGLLPFSNVGYSVSDTQAAIDPTAGNTADYARSYTGGGGLHQLHVETGVKVLKNLSVGMSAFYFWGDINWTRVLYFSSVSGVYSYNHQSAAPVSSYKPDFGAQYILNISKKHSAAVGVIYSPKLRLNNDHSITTQMVSNSTGTVVSTIALEPDATFEVPNTFGVEFTYNYDKHLIIGPDYSLQQRSGTKFDADISDGAVYEDFDETYTYYNHYKVSVGAEYIPNLTRRSYLSHIKHRLGVCHTTPYYEIGSKEAARGYGATASFGLSVPRSRSIFSISGQFVRISGQGPVSANESIFHMSIGLMFNKRRSFKCRAE